MILTGFGIGLLMSPTNTDALGRVTGAERAQASGLMQTVRQLGGTLGIAVIGALVLDYQGTDTSAQHVANSITVGFVAAAIAFLVALLLGWPAAVEQAGHRAGRAGRQPLTRPAATTVTQTFTTAQNSPRPKIHPDPVPSTPQARRTAMSIRFIDDNDFNDQFGRTLVATTKGSADLGEALAVAARIVPGDFTSWSTEWTRKADEVLAGGDHSLSVDDPISARKAYLRASEYYRQSFFFARTDLDDPVLHTAYTAHVNAFRAAVPLLPCATTVVDIDTVAADGVAVNGYLFRPDASGTARPTVIAPAGYDSTAENGYVLSAAAALERKMNCLVFEGPGQGGVLYERRLPLRPNYESVLTPVVDWLVNQPGVDPAALVLFGRSFAGYLHRARRCDEHRLAALICDPAEYDFGGTSGAPRRGNWSTAASRDPTLESDLVAAHDDPNPASTNAFGLRMPPTASPRSPSICASFRGSTWSAGPNGSAA